MNHSKTGINEPFYKWLDDVRRAMRKEKELQEKLKLYERKMISCKGVSYDRIGSTSTSPNEKDLLYWIEKINETEKMLKLNLYFTTRYYVFYNLLSETQRIILSSMLHLGNRTCITYMTRQRKHTILLEIYRIWNKYK